MSAINHPVIGVRSWVPAPDFSGALKSRFHPYIWGQGINVAEHTGRDEDHIIPSKSPCNCGLQAHYSYDDSLYYFKHSAQRKDLVYGVVKGWGHMQVHPDGWRSQYAEILAILPSPNTLAARHAAEWYDVPIINSLDNLDMVLSEYGKTVPEELRPNKQTALEGVVRWVVQNPKDAWIIGSTLGGILLFDYTLYRIVKQSMKVAHVVLG